MFYQFSCRYSITPKTGEPSGLSAHLKYAPPSENLPHRTVREDFALLSALTALYATVLIYGLTGMF